MCNIIHKMLNLSAGIILRSRFSFSAWYWLMIFDKYYRSWDYHFNVWHLAAAFNPCMHSLHWKRLLLNLKESINLILLLMSHSLFPLLYPFLLLLPVAPLLHCIFFLSASSSLHTGQFPEEKTQTGSGFIPSWRPQVTPPVETPTQTPHSALPGPPPPLPPRQQPVTSQTVIAPPTDQGTGIESNEKKWHVLSLKWIQSQHLFQIFWPAFWNF